jgi:hypothetical protein
MAAVFLYISNGKLGDKKMSSNDYIDLQLVVVMTCCVLMLAVLAIEQGSTIVRMLIFGAGLLNAIAAVLFIHRERKMRQAAKSAQDSATKAA